jgi:hypothetical protein
LEILVGKKNGKKNSANSKENVNKTFAKKLGSQIWKKKMLPLMSKILRLIIII